MKTTTVLLEVIERTSRASLLPLEERQITPLYEGESGYLLEDRAKRIYLSEIENRIKYEPRTKALLTGKEWRIDCACIN